ncbi:exodeoxyribonuclease VII large subunit [Anaerofustis stercorihominis]|uniref:Exodeoxyribonuclease 7 large subunit n=2 Tax=Anaerofustis stercorihominis TaxID=214853 RepID=B1C649_9FIRM|nr:exodeoxyribonuclease VII large subunit [Anaerofustis stercorihominis]EDS73334.1 exodeoxyribonuclease VII, large subunit [Anaerofustis stercorihominis DSM 17244]MCQ4794785.1 exodeoxyribonuclease VII large subunit [Anaerofustis stercorihominis]MCR2033075.1 exodeoxyribonuclease VII large subunit [Anaerofustis stercorihominis]RGD75630.1 exodeoxyribonuclease VII large subunit [Anaerofustis stercorihominis]
MIDNVILTVRDVNKYIKTLLDYDELLSNLRVEGEVSNYKRHSSGHLYFSIKDNSGKINCVMFKSDTYSLAFEPMDGMKVIIEGYVSVFERNGNYQLYVKSMKKKGIGRLYEEYNRLLEELKAQGYFDQDKKKSIPSFVDTVAVVTSPTGAAVRDIISVIKRRNKNIKIIVCPVTVQGEGSGEEVAQMIYDINRLKLADVIITGRGGGSIEELWAFNERVVAQAVFDSAIPVVSAVGHETDFTICDFVADFRAPTPSVAGEVVSEPLDNIVYTVDVYEKKINNSLKGLIDKYTEKLNNIINKPVMKRPNAYIENMEQYIDTLKDNIDLSLYNKINLLKHKVDSSEKLIHSLSAVSVLERGFAIVESNNKVITSVNDVNVKDEISIRMKDGKLNSVISEIEGE